jgi:cytochrome c biogenesis protein
LTGMGTDKSALSMKPGQTVDLPNGLGTVSLSDIKRFATLDIHHDPTQIFVLIFAILILAGLLTSLFVPRRRMWVKAIEQEDGSLRIEYAGLARGDDPNLRAAVAALADKHIAHLTDRKNI